MTIELVDKLIGCLNQAQIRYCHWKSNFYLEGSLSDEDDIDLLIDRKSFAVCQEILLHLGFKQASIQWGTNPPGIFHYYGTDAASGQLIHVHLYTVVLTGESFIKSHLLPFEQMLLDQVDRIGEIKVTSHSAELVLFVIRNFIKYGSLLDVIYLQKNPSAPVKELAWLQARVDMSGSLDLLEKYCPVIERTLFLECIRAVSEQAPLTRKVLLAYRVRHALRGYAKQNMIARNFAYLQMLAQFGWRRITGNRRNKVLTSGGAVIAFVGPEATGKSTLVNASRDWLGKALTTHKIHAGKPPSTWLTSPINLVLPAARKLVPNLRMSRRTGHVAAPEAKVQASSGEGKASASTSVVYALRAVALAWDRRALLLRARRAAARGEIVICDRYPSSNIGAMDSPRLGHDAMQTGGGSALYRWLARLERRLYDEIPPPDAVLRLHVSIATAMKRNTERVKANKEDNLYVESRHRDSKEWRKPGTKYLMNIDTEQSLADTVQQVKRAIWEVL